MQSSFGRYAVRFRASGRTVGDGSRKLYRCAFGSLASFQTGLRSFDPPRTFPFTPVAPSARAGNATSVVIAAMRTSTRVVRERRREEGEVTATLRATHR